ncbi:ATP-binding protein [Cohnella herbarum]|uniref:histidine kinase n=1 Tax=Cohnella herbarum TaxID=2728023 RepID=A0A7Z2VKW0_9BACL|nr:ATP-binding protein [Cohnella herbarum]QJD84901.1 hypothetical protein HH215_18090 [Cohnella herbarum]
MQQKARRRSLTSEMMLWILLLVVLPVIALTVYFYITITSALTEAGYEKELQTNHTAQRSIDALGETILGVTITNGYWEVNRQALLARDMEWLEQNIGDMPRVVPNIDFVAEADLKGRILVQSGDVELFTDTVKVPYLLDRFEKEKEFSGILDTSKGLAIIAVSQVTGDQGENGTAGMLITGHYLNERNLLRLSDTLQTDIALLLNSGQFLSSTESLDADDLLSLTDGHRAGESLSVVGQDDFSRMKSAVSFKEMTGRVVGILYTQSESVTSMQTVNALNKQGIYSLVAMIFLLVLVAYLLRHRIMLPLRHLTIMLEQVAAGRQVDDIPKQVEQADKELLQAFARIGSLNQHLEQTVRKRTEAIQNLLNYSQQGFFTVHSDLTIGEEYSLPCVRIFGREISGADLPGLFYSDNERERRLLKEIVEEIFLQKDELKREMVVTLLPEELALGELTVSAEYKLIDDASGTATEIMVILTDITEKRKIELQIARERLVQQMVVQVVTHLDETNQILGEFKRFCEMGIVDNMNSRLPIEHRLLSVYKRIHTFKGSFSLLQFPHIVPRLHELETQIQLRIEAGESQTEDQNMQFLRSLRLHTWVDEDVEALKEILGEEMLFQHNRAQTVTIRRSEWLSLESKLTKALTESRRLDLLAELREVRNKPLRKLVDHYAEYLVISSERLGIQLHPMRIEGEEISVDAQRFLPFSQSLIHVFRNIAVHGIEPREERLSRGKDVRGTVIVRFSKAGSQLELSISDDGRGIDCAKLRQRLAAKGFGDERTLRGLTDEEVILYIFKEELTTAESVSELSGRGVGLSAVKDEVDKLGGQISVTSVFGQGTTFTFTIPHEDEHRKLEEGLSDETKRS